MDGLQVWCSFSSLGTRVPAGGCLSNTQHITSRFSHGTPPKQASPAAKLHLQNHKIRQVDNYNPSINQCNTIQSDQYNTISAPEARWTCQEQRTQSVLRRCVSVGICCVNLRQFALSRTFIKWNQTLLVCSLYVGIHFCLVWHMYHVPIYFPWSDSLRFRLLHMIVIIKLGNLVLHPLETIESDKDMENHQLSMVHEPFPIPEENWGADLCLCCGKPFRTPGDQGGNNSKLLGRGTKIHPQRGFGWSGWGYASEKVESWRVGTLRGVETCKELWFPVEFPLHQWTGDYENQT